MMRNIKETQQLLLVVDFNHIEQSISCNPNRVLYAIAKSEKRYSVKYHGCCEVELSDSFDAAYKYILKNLKYIIRLDGRIDFQGAIDER